MHFLKRTHQPPPQCLGGKTYLSTPFSCNGEKVDLKSVPFYPNRLHMEREKKAIRLGRVIRVVELRLISETAQCITSADLN